MSLIADINLETSFTVSLSCICNIGVGLTAVGPTKVASGFLTAINDYTNTYRPSGDLHRFSFLVWKCMKGR